MQLGRLGRGLAASLPRFAEAIGIRDDGASSKSFLNALSDVNAEVLSVFRKTPNLNTSLTDLAHEIGKPEAIVEAEVKALETLGLVTRTRTGSFELLSLNKPRDQEIQHALVRHFESR
jgi:hypothetical protein